VRLARIVTSGVFGFPLFLLANKDKVSRKHRIQATRKRQFY